MIRGINFSLLVIFGIFALSCTETKEISPEDIGINYIPLQVGNYAIFHIEGIEYINPIDSLPFSYQLKESVVDSFQNLESGISYKLLREIRTNESDTWKTDSVWTARKDEMRAIRTENNVPYVNLVFPLAENKSWDGNGFNEKDSDEYEMVDVEQAFEGQFGSFDKSVTVIQEYIPDIYINFISKKEVYSKDIGLVYKENIILKYKQGDDYGSEIIESGIRYFQSILEYGQE